MFFSAGIIASITSPCRSLLTLHINPDMDSVGSNIAMMKLLEHYGHSVSIYSKNLIPDSFAFLDKNRKIKVQDPRKIPWDNYDIYWALDMSDFSRVGEKIVLPSYLKTIVIDHHMTNIGWGNVNFVDKNAPSTSSIIYSIIKKNGLFIDVSIAEALFVGIIGDTGYLQYPKISSNTFREVAELIDIGIDKDKIFFRLLKCVPFEDLDFYSRVYKRARIIKDKRIVIFTIPLDLKNLKNTSKDKILSVSHFSQTIRGTDLGIVIAEIAPYTIEVHFRARTKKIDVSKIAEKLGGGGHRQAAGVTLVNITLDEAEKKILEFF